jgi:hypothetical protein
VATYLHQQLAIGLLVKGSNSFGQLEGVEERQQGDLLRSRHLPESAGTSKMPQSALEFLLRLRRLISHQNSNESSTKDRGDPMLFPANLRLNLFSRARVICSLDITFVESAYSSRFLCIDFSLC